MFVLKQLGSQRSNATCLPDTHQRSFRHRWRRRWVRVRTNPGHPSSGRGWALQSPFLPNTLLLVGCPALSRLYLQHWKSKHRFSREVLSRGVWSVLHFTTERKKLWISKCMQMRCMRQKPKSHLLQSTQGALKPSRTDSLKPPAPATGNSWNNREQLLPSATGTCRVTSDQW